MAIIYSYQENNELRLSDMLVGTATTLHDGKVRKVTKNFTLGELKTFISGGDLILTNGGTSGPATLADNVLNIPVYQGALTLTTTGTSGAATLIGNTLNIPQYGGTPPTPTLQQVTTAGNTTSNNIIVSNGAGSLVTFTNGGILFESLSSHGSIFSTSGFSLVDDITTQQFSLDFDGLLLKTITTGAGGRIKADLLTSTARTYQLPDASGTIALTSDIPSLAGYVQTTRTLTINGTTYDLSANRTWNVGTVTDVTATGQITSTGGATPVISTLMHTDRLIGRTTAGSGVMEEISVGAGLTLSAGTLSATSTGGSIPHATASGTDTYTATVTGVTSYADGDAYLIRFTNGNTTGATLNINALGAVPLYENNDGALIGGDIWAGAEMLCVYNSGSNIFQCIGTSANSLFSYVTNADTVPITKGMPVYAAGGQGDRLTVKRAFNTSDATSAQTVGVVLTSSIGVNQKGIIIIQGLLDGLSILPTSTWADGDPVYLASTAGDITNVKQYAPNHLVYLGTVTTASNGSAGRWYVRVQNGYELDELHNVQAQSPTVNDVLYYFGGSPGQWKTASIPTVLGYTPFQLPSLTSGSVLFSNGTTIAQDNANFFWDDANNRLGIGTSTPYTSLNISDNTTSQILLRSTTGIEGISSFNGGTLASFDITAPSATYQYGPLTMMPAISFITFAGFEVLTGNITTGYIPRKTAIGVVDSNIYDNGTNVGIGTTTPATALDVNGVITATGGDSTSWNAKQDALVSGTNIKTINSNSVLGSGDLSVQETLVSGTNIKTINGNDILGSGDLTISGASGGIHAQKVIYPSQYTNLYVVYSGAPIAQVSTANRLICMPFFPNQTFTSQSLVVNVTTLSAGGLAKVLIFDDVDGRPTTKLYESADFDCSTTGQKTASVSFTFTAGITYWIGFVSNNATNAFSHLAQGSVYAFSTNSATGAATHGWLSVTYASIPSPLSALSYQGGNIPLVSIRNS